MIRVAEYLGWDTAALKPVSVCNSCFVKNILLWQMIRSLSKVRLIKTAYFLDNYILFLKIWSFTDRTQLDIAFRKWFPKLQRYYLFSGISPKTSIVSLKCA